MVVDAFSKWFEVAIMRQMTSTVNIQKLEEIFAQHGHLDMLVSDNGTNFASEEFAEFLRSNGIIHEKIDPYHPSSNGLAERAMHTVKESITKTPADCIHTKIAPFPVAVQDNSTINDREESSRAAESAEIEDQTGLVRPNLQGKVQMQQSQMKMNHDKKVDGRTTAVGDTVNVKNFSQVL